MTPYNYLDRYLFLPLGDWVYGSNVVAKLKETRRNETLSEAGLRDLQNRKRSEILKDIREQIARSAALLGYGFVLDCSGRVPGEQGMVRLYPQSRDFTNHVITELNRNQTKAPANKGNKNK